MGQVNCRKHYLSLRKSLVLYVIAFVVLAVFLSVTTFSICDGVAEGIRASYPPSGEKYYLTNEQGEQLGDGTYIGTVPVPMSKEDERTIALLEKLPIVATPLYSAFCIIAAALLFYRNRLKKPLAELRTASEKIANNDLDFSIDYDNNDELGQLCASFEIMRTTLADNFSKMWRRLRVSDHFHFKEEIELIENIMNFSQAKVLLRTNICKENKDEIIALHKYIFEKFGNERIEINPNRTIKYHQDDSFEMLSVQEYAEVAYQIKLLWSEQKGKFELPVPRSTPCKFPYGNAYAISPEGYCTFCSGSMDQEKKYFFDVDIENKKMFSVRKECKKCNILPLCLGGCIIQYNLRAGACTYEKYELKNILISYIKHIS